MALTFPTKEQIRASIQSIWQSERPDADANIYSDLWLYSRVGAAAVFRLHQTIQRALNAIFPTTSYGTYLDNWMNLFGLSDGSGGFGRVLARGCDTAEGCTVTLTIGQAANALQGEQLTDSAGRIYEIGSHGILPIGANNLDVTGVTKSAATNLAAGVTLTFVSPPAGVNAAATTATELRGGANLETDSEGRARLLRQLRDPPGSGNVAQWVDVIEDVSPGALKAYVWPKRDTPSGTVTPPGYGTTDYCAFATSNTGSGRYIAAADQAYEYIGDAVDLYLPVLIARNSRQLTVTDDPIDLELTVTLADNATNDQKCDWDSEGNKTTVNTSDSATGIITAVAAVTSLTVTNGIAVDDIVVINGVPGIVTAIDGADNKVFTVGSWPSSWGVNPNPLGGYEILSGGGLIGNVDYTDAAGDEVARTGILGTLQTYFDSLGPQRGTYAAVSIPDWDDTMRMQAVQSDLIQFAGGAIIDVTIDAVDGGAAADYEPNGGVEVWGTLTYAVSYDELITYQVYV